MDPTQIKKRKTLVDARERRREQRGKKDKLRKLETCNLV